VCDLKLQWEFYKWDARIRLVTAENVSACITVNCEVCRLAIAQLHVVPSWLHKVSTNPIIKSTTRLISHPYMWKYDPTMNYVQQRRLWVRGTIYRAYDRHNSIEMPSKKLALLWSHYLAPTDRECIGKQGCVPVQQIIHMCTTEFAVTSNKPPS
jgi:hypothetical protein